MPGQGSAYVLEVPVGVAAGSGGGTGRRAAGGGSKGDSSGDGGSAAASSGTPGGAGGGSGSAGDDRPRESDTTVMPVPTQPMRGTTGTAGAPSGTGGAQGRRGNQAGDGNGAAAVTPWTIPAAAEQDVAPTGRRRALRRPDEGTDGTGQREGGEGAAQGDGGMAQDGGPQPTGRRARRARAADDQEADHGNGGPAQERAELPAAPIPHALPPAGPSGQGERTGQASGRNPLQDPRRNQPQAPGPAADQRQTPAPGQGGHPGQGQAPAQGQAPEGGTGRRARRAIEPANPEGGAAPPQGGAPVAPQWPDAGSPQAAGAPVPPQGRRPGDDAQGNRPGPGGLSPAQSWPSSPQSPQDGQPDQGNGHGGHGTPGQPHGPHAHTPSHSGGNLPALPSAPSQPSWPAAPQGAGGETQSQGGHSRAISVRTLGQGVPFAQQAGDPQTQTQAVQAQTPQGLPAQVTASGSGRRRRLNPPQGQGQGRQGQGQNNQMPGQIPSQAQEHGPGGETQARQHPQADPDSGQLPVRRPDAPQGQGQSQAQPQSDDRETALLRPVPSGPAAPVHEGGRAYAIGAPAEGADEGPEPLDGPNGAVDVTDVAGPHDPGRPPTTTWRSRWTSRAGCWSGRSPMCRPVRR